MRRHVVNHAGNSPEEGFLPAKVDDRREQPLIDNVTKSAPAISQADGRHL
ncbi:hypothetical protein [Sphingomonas oryzagri]